MRVKCAWLVVGILLVPTSYGEEAKTKTLTVTVSETAGLRRFGYPVHVYLPITDDSITKDRIRLLEAGKPVAAQFRPILSFVPNVKKVVALDFNVSIGPLEKKTYTVEYGSDVKAGPEPKGGLTVEETEAAITVRSGGMTYVVRRDLKGLLDEVRTGKTSYLKPDSAGLLVNDKPVLGNASAKVEVAYHGPLATVLRFERVIELRNAPRFVGVEITFPRSKSWVEFHVQLLGRQHATRSLSASLNLAIEGKPTLVDFGAGSMVYTTLAAKEAASLTASSEKKPAWEVRVGKMPNLTPFALPAGKLEAIPAEGWAHVMDSKRCTALAIHQFGKRVEHRILAEADGKLTWTREVTGETEMRFWLHFVGMPVQVGAVTSPQSMMAPLQVDVK
jgi:hypothetical protein